MLASARKELWEGRFTDAEHGFASLLTHTHEGVRHGAVLGLSQARLLGRLDVRGAFTMLQPLTHTRGPREARMVHEHHAVLAYLFAQPVYELHDPLRSVLHAQQARSMAASEGCMEALSLAALSSVLATLVGGDGPAALAEANAWASELTLPRSPVARCLALETASLAALILDDAPAERAALELALHAARSTRFMMCQARLLVRLARHDAARGAGEQALRWVDEGREALCAADAENAWVGEALNRARKAACSEPQPRPSTPFEAALGLPALRRPGPDAK